MNNFAEDLKSLLHENLHRLLMTPPMVFIFRLHDPAADLYDLYGIYELQQDRRSSDAV